MATTPPPGASPTPADVIHNIGYRKYDGPRLGRAYARRSLYSQSLRGAYGLGRSAKSKVLPMILLGVMCLPALIMVAVAVFTDMSKLPVEYTRYAVIMQALITLFVASQAPQSVSRDLRFKTTPLYFSRPIERIDYVAAKYAALTTALFVLTAVPLLILYVGALLAKLGFATQTAGFAKGLLSVLLLSLLFAGIGLVIAAVTPRRGFGVAAIIAVFVITYGAVSAVQGVAASQEDLHVIGWLGVFSPITLIDGFSTWFLGATSAFPDSAGPPDALAGAVYLLVVAGLVAGCFGLLMRRYRKVGLS
ncbi:MULTISPECIES: ABC-2 transporter permease [unclassified Streptomyces]|uniref:ABC-2 transporter permease n=1 Tax=unclassified Streptomyces TaxID=2593676 RepID=UPI000B87B6E6|nr:MULTISPECIES: ABC transporter permease subunit [unclassified Streptomyces]MYS24975.1 ABC transporter permease subunit [Streptomyces sp. SID4948]